ncbi:MAG TPA: hypothetical protein VF979_02920 [Streptosporangiaceae bacterium]
MRTVYPPSRTARDAITSREYAHLPGQSANLPGQSAHLLATQPTDRAAGRA